MKADRETVAETTPAHDAAEGVTATLPGTTAQNETANPGPPPATTNYIVKPGDTLSGLSAKFQIPVNAIREANEMTNDRIYYGKTIKIPASATIPGAAVATAETETKPGVSEEPSSARTETVKTVAKPATKPSAPNSENVASSIPPVPPPPAGTTKTEGRGSLDAAFGAQDPDRSGSPEPRMPALGSQSPFYDNPDSTIGTVPDISGQAQDPKKDAKDIPLPKE